MATETWLPVVGYEGLYEVSDQGRVRSLCRRRPRVLKQQPITRGYLSVGLYRDGRQRTIVVHRLVMAAFAGPCPDGLEVRHSDGNLTNNRLLNLLYGTRSQNQLDSVQHGTHRNARKTHCPHGHPYSAENTYVHPRGTRDCRACRDARQQSRRSALAVAR